MDIVDASLTPDLQYDFMIRTTVRSLTGAALIICTFWNLHIVDVAVGDLGPRETEEVTVIENRYRLIEFELLTYHPSAKRFGYVSTRTISGAEPDGLDDLRWAQLRYVMIPRILVRGTAEPFVIGSFNPGDPIPETVDTLIKVFDAGNGYVLYKQRQTP